jgi:uncharacterized protein (TIGR03435 family)
MIAIGCLWLPDHGATVFDVVSIRPSKPGTQRASCKVLPGGHLFACHNVTVELLLRLTLSYVPVTIKGAPSWFGNLYDLDATVEGEITEDELAPPMLSLFRDRFGLAAHDETVQQTVYILEQAKSGAKLKPSAPGTEYSLQRSDENVVVKGETMEHFSGLLGRRPDVNTTVIDKTGLAGKFDFTFPYISAGNPTEPPADATPDVVKRTAAAFSSTIDAVNSIGLRLRPEKRDGTALVIDQIRRPTEN